MTAATGRWLDVRASAAVAGRFVALEQELHRRLGVLAVTAEPPAARCFLAEASLAHAWRAALFEALLPVSIGLPAGEELVVLPGPDLARLSHLEAADEPVTLLCTETYPALVEAYEATAAAVSPVSDGPLALAARRAAGDLRRVMERGAHAAAARR